MWQQVLDIQYTTDIVCIVLIYWYATVIVLNYALQHIGIARTDIKVNNVLSACHYLLGCLIAKSDNALQHALLILNLIFVRKLKSLFQIVNAQGSGLFLHYFLSQHAAVNEYRFQWPEELTEKDNSRNNPTAERKRSLTAVYLWHNLTKQQQQEGEQNGDEEKLQHIGLELNQ